MSDLTNDERKALIEEALTAQGWTAASWREDEDGQTEAVIGKFTVIEEDEDRGLYADEEGVLSACVVGAREYGNLQVAYYFTGEGMDSGNQVGDLSCLDGPLA